MSEKIKTILSILIILIILPYIITYALQGNMLFDIEQDETERNMENGEQTEILTGILAGQIAMDSPAEAIRAQAGSRRGAGAVIIHGGNGISLGQPESAEKL